jgi:DNA-binding NtrC family response regulator
MAFSSKVLIVSADAEGRRALGRALSRAAVDVEFAATVEEARALAAREPIRLVFCAEQDRGKAYRELLGKPGFAAGRIPVIVASRCVDTREYLEAMCAGAFDFVAPPYRPDEVARIVSSALHFIPAA